VLFNLSCYLLELFFTFVPDDLCKQVQLQPSILWFSVIMASTDHEKSFAAQSPEQTSSIGADRFLQHHQHT